MYGVMNAQDSGVKSTLERADRRRKALRTLLDKNNLTCADVATSAGLSNANTLYNFLGGRSNSLSAATYEKLARVIPGATIDLLNGTAPRKAVAAAGTTISVTTFAQSGEWRGSGEIPLNRRREVIYDLPADQAEAHPFAVEVREPGAELLYPAGTILIVVSPDRVRTPLAAGDRVILQRVHDKKVEVSVREIQVSRDGAYAWPRSSDPKHQQPMYVPWPYRHAPWRTHQEIVRIVGVVLSAISHERGL